MDLLEKHSMKRVLRVGGVPEHFNLAWHLAIENGLFEEKGIEIQWRDVPGGTGAMCKLLSDGDLDLAIALTEGVVADIMQGNPSKIVQFYVNSPLRWGIYTSGKNELKNLENIQGLKYAISRFKSGSHLMAYVNARNLNIKVNQEDFVIVGNLEGARKSLANNESQLFMWEKFTTKPYADSGEFKYLGECRTPWPCFAVVASNELLQHQNALLNEVLEIMNTSCIDLKFKEKEATKMIAWRYQLKQEDAQEWFNELEYAYSEEIDEIQFMDILNDLKSLGIIDRIPQLEEICYSKNLIDTLV